MKGSYKPVLAFLSLPILLIGFVCFHEWWGFLMMAGSLTLIINAVRWALRTLHEQQEKCGPEG